MLNALSTGRALAITTPGKPRRLRRVRRAGRWLSLTGWIVLPLMPMLAIGLSKLLGLGF